MDRQLLSVWVRVALLPLWTLVVRHPVLALLVAALLALLWGASPDGFDATHTVWSERFWPGFAGGAVLALLFAAVLAVGRWLDDQAGEARGSYFAAWAVLVVLAALPAVARPGMFPTEVEVPDGPPEPLADDAVWLGLHVARLYLPAGLFLVLAGGVAARFTRLRDKHLLRPVGWGAAAVVAAGYVVMTGIHMFVPDAYTAWSPAPVAAFLLLCLFVAVVGLAGRFVGRYVYPALFALITFLFAVAGWLEPEHRVPGLEPEYDRRVHLADYPALRATATDLADDEQALIAWRARMGETYPDAPPEQKPVVVVCVSGGASTSALYVAQALLDLEALCPGITGRIRIITGASGGMLGAAYYVSQYRPGGMVRRHPGFAEYLDARRRYAGPLRPGEKPLTPDEFAAARRKYRDGIEQLRKDLAAGLEADFLSPIVQKWVHNDLPRAFVPAGTTNDRGFALEAAWHRHLKGTPVRSDPADPSSPLVWDAARGALDVPFADLRAEEARGELPSLVFTPMLVEDGRQLIISNLDLGYMTTWAKLAAVETGWGAEGAGDRKPAYSALEFYRLFPNAGPRFKLSTAVRLNASFPFFSPAADLPTVPRRQVVDAGYFDNYGLVVAARWIDRHRVWLLQTRTPVWVLQLWTYGYDGTAPHPDRPTDEEVGRGWSVTTPVSGLFTAWRSNQAYRGEERLNGVLEEINLSAVDADREPTAAARMRRDIGDRGLPMNWDLTSYHRLRLRREARDFDRLAEFAQLHQLAEAGKPPPAPPPPTPAGTPEQRKDLADKVAGLPLPDPARYGPKQLPPKK